MQIEVTAKQTAFFSQNGYIEFEGINFREEEIFASAKNILASRCKISPNKLSRIPAPQLYKQGRDLWRSDKILKTFLLQQIFPLASAFRLWFCVITHTLTLILKW